MMDSPTDFKDQLLSKLLERGVKPQCEICGHNHWAVVEQAIPLQMTVPYGAFKISPSQIPSAGLICKKCGNLRLFALGVLDLLPKPEGELEK